MSYQAVIALGEVVDLVIGHLVQINRVLSKNCVQALVFPYAASRCATI
jgi:hypothetical protein